MNTLIKPVILYDGHCGFCQKQIASLKKMLGDRALYESFQDPKVLPQYPELNYEECMKEIKLVTPERKVYGGAQAIFYALSLIPLLRPLRWIYPLPLLKQIIDFTYQTVARNRYKLQGRTCPTGTCHLHDHKS